MLRVNIQSLQLALQAQPQSEGTVLKLATTKEDMNVYLTAYNQKEEYFSRCRLVASLDEKGVIRDANFSAVLKEPTAIAEYVKLLAQDKKQCATATLSIGSWSPKETVIHTSPFRSRPPIITLGKEVESPALVVEHFAGRARFPLGEAVEFPELENPQNLGTVPTKELLPILITAISYTDKRGSSHYNQVYFQTTGTHLVVMASDGYRCYETQLPLESARKVSFTVYSKDLEKIAKSKDGDGINLAFYEGHIGFATNNLETIIAAFRPAAHFLDALREVIRLSTPNGYFEIDHQGAKKNPFAALKKMKWAYLLGYNNALYVFEWSAATQFQYISIPLKRLDRNFLIGVDMNYFYRLTQLHQPIGFRSYEDGLTIKSGDTTHLMVCMAMKELKDYKKRLV